MKGERSRLWAVLALVPAVAVVAAGCRPARYEMRFDALGTEARLVVVAPSQSRAAKMFEAARGQIELVDRLMSTYREDSEISLLNARGAEEAVKLSPPTLEVVRRAVEVSRLSGGAFDITYAPLRSLWRRAEKDGAVPDETAVRDALSRVGYAKLVVEADTVRFAVPGMEVDLGGIAKGYAIDLAVRALQEAGARSGIVDIGGDVRLFGRPAEREKWRVRVRKPPGGQETIDVELPPCAVTTSGDYERGQQVGERWFSHIKDPRTGRPVAGVPSVTVVAPDATTADALATALSVLDAEGGVRLADSLPGVECLIMTRREDGGLAKHMSSGFAALIAP